MTDDPTDGLHDPSKFLVFDLPWSVVRTDGEWARLVNPDGRVAVVLFTDADLARRGAAAAGGVPMRVVSWPSLYFHLDGLAAQGVTHVVFDPGPRVRNYPVGDVLDALRDRG